MKLFESFFSTGRFSSTSRIIPKILFWLPFLRLQVSAPSSHILLYILTHLLEISTELSTVWSNFIRNKRAQRKKKGEPEEESTSTDFSDTSNVEILATLLKQAEGIKKAGGILPLPVQTVLK